MFICIFICPFYSFDFRHFFLVWFKWICAKQNTARSAFITWNLFNNSLCIKTTQHRFIKCALRKLGLWIWQTPCWKFIYSNKSSKMFARNSKLIFSFVIQRWFSWKNCKIHILSIVCVDRENLSTKWNISANTIKDESRERDAIASNKQSINKTKLITAMPLVFVYVDIKVIAADKYSS